MPPTRLLAPAALLFVAACVHIGSRGDQLQASRSPAGSDVTLEIAGSSHVVHGELLAARDSAIVLQAGQRIVLVHYGAIARASIDDAPSLRYRARPDEPALQRLRLVSRYPQDISEALMTRLLAEFGQAQLEVMRP